MTLWLFATVLINPVERNQRAPASGFWPTAMKIFAGLLMLFVALFWLARHTDLGPALGQSQVQFALRIASDVAYVAAGAIMLAGYRRERRTPRNPPTSSPQVTELSE